MTVNSSCYNHRYAVIIPVITHFTYYYYYYIIIIIIILLLWYYYFYYIIIIVIIIIIIIYNLMLSFFKYPVRQNQIREKIQFTGIMIIVTSPVVYLLKIHLFT